MSNARSRSVDSGHVKDGRFIFFKKVQDTNKNVRKSGFIPGLRTKCGVAHCYG